MADNAATAAVAAAGGASATRLVTLATCNLNQWALDFAGNSARIVASIEQSKALGARFRLGPELEVPGYSCEDHFYEADTEAHGWDVLASILSTDVTYDILCDIGMPVMHHGVLYNCRIWCLDGKICLIRPKMHLANDGNYRETRWFTGWKRPQTVVEHYLPSVIQEVTGQKKVPFGDAVIALNDTVMGTESCEELFVPNSPHVHMGLDGVEIFANGSGSHHQLRKLNRRVDLMVGATTKVGGVYMYANQQGCDGTRLYFDGSAMIFNNGECVAQASQFGLQDVEVVTATVDLAAVRSYRASIKSACEQASTTPGYPRVDVDFALEAPGGAVTAPSSGRPVSFLSPAEEIAFGPSAWLWDYLRRSGLRGFFLPLSGGIDSSSTATIVGNMCNMIVAAAADGDEGVIADVRRVAREDPDGDYVPTDPRELANRIFYTCYMGSSNSSGETRARAAALAAEVGAYHSELEIDDITAAIEQSFVASTGKTPAFKVNGGSNSENLALQNIQARSRMVLAYFYAQLLPWSRDSWGSLLVLGSANVDEALRGYYTKYDCSAADVNPIGGISKTDLRMFIAWAAENLGYTSLVDILGAPPTAELEPITEDYVQNDEDDMGMTYAELSRFGTLRKINRCGPLSMFDALVHEWSHLAPTAVADKVKYFFRQYAINRHKMTTLTPSYHAENYSPDDNRFDLRPFLYPVKFDAQFAAVDRRAALIESLRSTRAGDKRGAGAANSDNAGDGVEPSAKRHKSE